MNFINRFIIIIATLSIMACSLIVLLQVFSIVPADQIGLPVWLSEQIISLSNSELPSRLVYGGICLGVMLTGAVLIFLELLPLFTREKQLLILEDELGKVEISESCVNKFINYEARLFNEISGVTSRVLAKKDGLHINSQISVKPETKISEIGLNFRNRLKSKIESNLGLLISTVIISAKIIQKKTQRSGRSLS